MSVTVGNKHYSDEELYAMPMDQLKELALAEGDEIAARQAQDAQIADAARHAQIKSAAQIAGETALAEKMPLEKLEAVVMEQGAEEERQIRQIESAEQIRRDNIERSAATKSKSEMTLEELAATPGVTLEEIQEREAEERAKTIASASPEARAEQSVRDLEQETSDLLYVRDQLKTKTEKELEEIVARKINEAQSQINRSLSIQQAFVASHPDYVAIPENANKMMEFVKGNGFKEFTPENLELAYGVLKSRGELRLRSGKESERETAPSAPSVRRSSSVSASHSQRSMYDKPAQLTEDEMYQLPIDEIRRRADAQLAAQSGADPARTARVATVGRFGLPL